MSVPITFTLAANTTAGGVVVAGGYLVFTGKLLTKALVDRLIKMYEQRLEEKDEQARTWREAHDVVKKSNDALITQLYQSLEIGRTTNSVLQALPTPSSSSSSAPSGAGGGPDATHVA
jgi:hypothetical protein